jgi:hypothetical protein
MVESIVASQENGDLIAHATVFSSFAKAELCRARDIEKRPL